MGILQNILKPFNKDIVSRSELAMLRSELFYQNDDMIVSNPLSVYDGFYSNNLGLGTSSDKAEMMSLYKERRRSRTELDNMYRSSGLIQRIVDLPINDMTRRGICIHHPEKVKLQQQLKDLKLIQKCNQAAKWGRIFRLGVIFLDLDDGQTLDKPVNLSTLKSINVASVHDSEQVQPFYINYWDDQPTWYYLSNNANQLIHRDRLLIFNGFHAGINNFLNCQGMGESVVDAIYRPFRNLDSDYNAASTMAKDFRVLRFNMAGFAEKTIGNKKEVAAAVKSRLNAMKKMMSLVNAFVMGENDKMDYMTQNVYGYADLVRLTRDYLSFVTGFPPRKLFNESSSTGINSGEAQQEQADWINFIEDFQHHILAPELDKFMKYLQVVNGYSEPIEYTFPNLIVLSELEEVEIKKINSETGLNRAKSDQIYYQMMAIDGEEVRRNRFIEIFGEKEELFTVETSELPYSLLRRSQEIPKPSDDPVMEEEESETPPENPNTKKGKGKESNRSRQKMTVRLKPEQIERLNNMRANGRTKTSLIEAGLEKVFMEMEGLTDDEPND